MSTTMMIWNLQNFSLSKIEPDPKKAKTGGAGAASFARRRPVVRVETGKRKREDEEDEQQILASRVADRITYVEKMFTTNALDLFVVVELYGRTNEVFDAGSVIPFSSNGGQGAIMLLNLIRQWTGGAASPWALVPPIVLGQFGFSEAVGVYYDTRSLQFIGPWVNGTTAGQTARVAMPFGKGVTVTPYADSWGNLLPTRTAPNNVSENQCAGQWRFVSAAGKNLLFPNDYNRPPFMTRFIDLANANRIIDLYSIHTTPATSKNAVRNLGAMGVTQSSVALIAGDFNVDPFPKPPRPGKPPDLRSFNAYGTLVNAGFKMLLSPIPPNTPYSAANVVPARQPYCMTHLVPTSSASPVVGPLSQTAASPNAYPRLGYMGSEIRLRLYASGAIDNVFALNAPNASLSVANSIIGVPYNAVAAPANTGDLIGNPALAYPPLDFFAGRPGGVPRGPRGGRTESVFQTAFRPLRDTSDHLALVMTF